MRIACSKAYILMDMRTQEINKLYILGSVLLWSLGELGGYSTF